MAQTKCDICEYTKNCQKKNNMLFCNDFQIDNKFIDKPKKRMYIGWAERPKILDKAVD